MKCYEWLYSRIGGRPWTQIIRENYHNHPLFWILGFSVFGVFLGHLFW